MEKVIMYTDGSCLGNPGRGGYGTILDFEGNTIKLSGGYRHTTNNRMELMACIKGVEELDHPCNLTIKSDSKYLIDALRLGWAIKWRDNGWRLSGGRRAENIDLWEILLDLLARHQVTFEWVKAHNGHLMNELCDQLAKDAANGSCLLEDVGYTKR